MINGFTLVEFQNTFRCRPFFFFLFFFFAQLTLVLMFGNFYTLFSFLSHSLHFLL